MSNDTYEPATKVHRSVILDIELDRDLRTLSYWEGRTKGDIMRDAIAAYVASQFSTDGVAEIGPDSREAYIAHRMGIAPATQGGQP